MNNISCMEALSVGVCECGRKKKKRLQASETFNIPNSNRLFAFILKAMAAHSHSISNKQNQRSFYLYNLHLKTSKRETFACIRQQIHCSETAGKRREVWSTKTKQESRDKEDNS